MALAGAVLHIVDMRYISFLRPLVALVSPSFFQLFQHNGGAPGVATIVDLYPYDGLGIVILANTRITTKPVIRNIGRAIADRILGLPEFTHDVQNELAPAPQAPLEPAQPHRSSELVGTYTNAGYGNFTLCSPIFPTSRKCLDVIQDFRTVRGAAGQPIHSTDLFSAWPRWWCTHLRLSPISGNRYAVEPTTLYVEGYGVDRSPFEDIATEEISVEFMWEEGRVVGLGMSFPLENRSWRAQRGGSVRDVADVWFNKL
jgi:hypothetical protein